MPNGRVKYTVPKAGVVEFTLFNGKGQMVAKLSKKTGSGTAYVTEWNLSKMVSGGMYFLAMKMDGKRVAICKVVSFR
jgi:hypothetical protein